MGEDEEESVDGGGMWAAGHGSREWGRARMTLEVSKEGECCEERRQVTHFLKA